MGEEPKLACSDEQLEISWRTNLTYSGYVYDIPALLYTQLMKKIRQKGSIMNLVVFSSKPR